MNRVIKPDARYEELENTKLLAAFGRVLRDYAFLDEVVALVFQRIMGNTSHWRHVYNEIDFWSRVKFIRNVSLEFAKDEQSERKVINKLYEQVSRAKRDRNDLVHGRWMERVDPQQAEPVAYLFGARDSSSLRPAEYSISRIEGVAIACRDAADAYLVHYHRDGHYPWIDKS